MTSSSPTRDDVTIDLDTVEQEAGENSIVRAGGSLPCQIELLTSKLLDVLTSLAPSFHRLNSQQQKAARRKLNSTFYVRTRPGFYLELNASLHVAYAGQPGGHGTQHQWRLFCTERLKAQIESVIKGTSLTTSGSQNSSNAEGKYSFEWGGLYLRSLAEMKIAEALDKSGVLFFANARGRVGLQDTLVSNEQLTGRVEADFLVIHRGKCMILEVDGQHHLEEGQTIRDYARDRVLLRSGVPTVRFTGRDCIEHPSAVVSEFLSILQNQ